MANKNSSTSQIAQTLQDPKSQVGLILTERLINMPAEITPPMYSMLLEEIQWAVDEKEPYAFTHYLIASKTYTEVESKLDQEDSRPSKKKRKDTGGDAEAFYFHPEDELLHQHALAFGNFKYEKQGDEGASDAKRAFQEMGVTAQGHLILIQADKFKGAVKALAEAIKAPS
jgi:protein BCP1